MGHFDAQRFEEMLLDRFPHFHLLPTQDPTFLTSEVRAISHLHLPLILDDTRTDEVAA